jgi:hypothetical protein
MLINLHLIMVAMGNDMKAAVSLQRQLIDVKNSSLISSTVQVYLVHLRIGDLPQRARLECWTGSSMETSTGRSSTGPQTGAHRGPA